MQVNVNVNVGAYRFASVHVGYGPVGGSGPRGKIPKLAVSKKYISVLLDTGDLSLIFQLSRRI